MKEEEEGGSLVTGLLLSLTGAVSHAGSAAPTFVLEKKTKKNPQRNKNAITHKNAQQSRRDCFSVRLVTRPGVDPGLHPEVGDG